MPNPQLRQHVKSNIQSYEVVGRGNFGKVYKAVGPDKQKYALKVSSLTDASGKAEDSLVEELSTLSRFTHPHIVRYVDGWEDRHPGGRLHIHLLMEFCAGLDLKQHLHQIGKPPAEEQYGLWLAHIASGLCHIHTHNVLHRNLKTSNILVQHKNKQAVLKIGDFGMSKILDHPDAFTNSRVGSPYFISPEAFRGDRYNHKTDIWSFGCIAYEMATLMSLFQTGKMRSLLSDDDRKMTSLLDHDINYDPFFKKLLCRMLRVDAAHRPDAREIVNCLDEQGFTSTYAKSLDSSCSGISMTDIPTTTSGTSVIPPTKTGNVKRKKRNFLRNFPKSQSSGSSSNSQTDTESLTPIQEDKLPSPSCSGGSEQDNSDRHRSKSESDVCGLQFALHEFTLDRRMAKTQKETKTVTFRADVQRMDSESDGSVFTPPKELGSSGSGYETDISNSGASTVYTPRDDRGQMDSASDYESGEESPDYSEADKTKMQEMKLVKTIHKYQTKITQTVGEDVLRVAYPILSIPDDSVMASKLGDLLGDQIDEVGPDMVFLRLIETRLNRLERRNRQTSRNLSATL